MTHGSLFSGIGGFDLAAEWVGWENKFHCEWSKFNQTILKYHFPKAESYGDITKTDFTIWRGRIDVLTGGFPCQPYSIAGKRKGKNDERHLWPEMLRAIREISPSWVVGENVRGIINWNDGMVFDEVQADLEAEGYEVLPFLLPAAGVDAPHERYRTWFVAYASNKRLQRSENIGSTGGGRENGNKQPTGFFQPTWQNFPTQSPICRGDDGISDLLDIDAVFEATGKKRGNHFSQWRNESIKAYGNAIVPQIAYMIFKSIQKCEELQGM